MQSFFFGNFTFFNSRNIERCDTCYEVQNTTPSAFSYIGNANKEAQLSDLRNHTIAIKQRIADKISVYLFVTIYIVCLVFFSRSI